MTPISQVCEIVLITSGRSTWSHALEAAVVQGAGVHVIRDKSWVEANNLALETVNTPCFMRVDDDMFLHPKALAFMLSGYGGAIAHTGKLYEHYTRRVAGKVKLYNIAKVRAIGGFRPNVLGKIDRTFERDAKSKCHRITTADKFGPVGLHACGEWEEQLEYEKMWGYKKSTREEMKKYTKSVRWQAKHATRIVERYNRASNTEFWKWLNR